MTDTMLEKMASVVSEELGSFGYFSFAKDEKACTSLAVAVLLAIREPSEARLIAGDDGVSCYPVDNNDTWQAMIDHILGGGK